MFKRFLILFFLFCFLIVPKQDVLAQKSVNVYFFWGEGCPHCAKEKVFLEKLEQKYSEVKIYDYDAWKTSENRQLLVDFGEKLNVNISGVPFTVIGEKYFIGWYNEEITGAAIEEAIQCVLETGCRDVGAEILFLENQNNVEEENCGWEEGKSAIPQKIKVPFLGEIETKNFSLPLLTIILGALDGFNPCAMWTLLFLISLLLGMKDRKRMWILGIAFIVASASVYFLFMATWLNLILFLGFIIWVRIVVGLIALSGGGYSLKGYFTDPKAGCKVTGTEKRQKIFEKLKKITQQKSFYLALGGIILLAFAVNLVELICSAGLPAVYAQVLALSHLVKWQYYLYILLYIFIFMLDDLFVFFVAMTTLQMTGITTKYSRISKLIGGLLMIIIGLLLLFKPEWLMFG
ncbi:MAG: thioredoxin family protein [Patescibacteria group bacterium]|nr:thioredoxin family protein [Patescibacteria group bacterium]